MRRIVLLALLAVIILAGDNTRASSYSGFAVDIVKRTGRTLCLHFGDRRSAVQDKLGPPLKSYPNSSFKPEGVRQIMEYSDLELEFDRDRLLRVEFYRHFQGKVRMIAPDKYNLEDWLRIGDPFSKIERLLRTLETKLQKKYHLRPFQEKDDVPIGSINQSIYAILISKDYGGSAWICIDKTYLSYVVSYDFDFTEYVVDGINLEVDEYISGYGFAGPLNR